MIQLQLTAKVLMLELNIDQLFLVKFLIELK